MKNSFVFLLTLFTVISFADVRADSRFFIPLSDVASVEMGLMEKTFFTEAWNDKNDPILFGQYVYKLDQLPKTGKAKVIPWSDSYFPTYRGGIATRWQKDQSTSHFAKDRINLYTFSQLRLNPRLIDSLSPAEKYDIFKGNYRYPVTVAEYNRTKSVVFNPDNQMWFGLCHAWATASFLYDEPGTATLTNPEGLEVTFYPSDIKALLMYIEDNGSTTGYTCGVNSREESALGRRCYNNRDDESLSFRDVNPASFHIVLTNEIGRNRRNFVFDRDAGSEVWNQPVYSYKVNSMKKINMRELASYSEEATHVAPGTKTVYVVNTTVGYGQEVYSSVDRVEPLIRYMTYDYTLELNRLNEVIGGTWLEDSVTNHPDFLWTQGRVTVTDPYMMDFIKVVYPQSLR